MATHNIEINAATWTTLAADTDTQVTARPVADTAVIAYVTTATDVDPTVDYQWVLKPGETVTRQTLHSGFIQAKIMKGPSPMMMLVEK